MEREKGVTFNVEKTNVMFFGKAKNDTKIDIRLKKYFSTRSGRI